MKIIKNEKLIKRNSIIGQWTSIAALLVLGGGMYLSFSNPANTKLVTHLDHCIGGGVHSHADWHVHGQPLGT